MQTFGRYEILEELGRGGMGAVYRARARDSGLEVAIKLLLDPRADDMERERFLREAQATAAMRHPGVIQVHEGGVLDGKTFIALELVPGGSLQGRLKREGQLEPAEVLRLGEGIADAMAHAHERGVLHRDLKPENVLLRADGSPVVSDFGLAKGRGGSLGGGQVLTQTGEVMGSPAYMAPEQADGSAKHATPAADVYGIGATLYALAAGRPPFGDQSSLLMVLNDVISKEPPPLRSGDPRLDELIHRCLSKDPSERPATLDLRDELRRLRTGARAGVSPVIARLMALTLVLLTLGVLFVFRPREDSVPPLTHASPSPNPSAAPSAPGTPEARRAARLATLVDRDPRQALLELDLSGDPSPELKRLRALALLRLERYRELKDLLLRRSDPELDLVRAEFELRTGQAGRLSRARLAPAGERAEVLWAEALVAQGRFEEAQRSFAALEQASGHAAPVGWRSIRARMRRFQGRYELALADVEVAKRDRLAHDPRPYLEQVRTLVELRDFRQAQVALEEAFAALGDLPSLLGLRAWLIADRAQELPRDQAVKALPAAERDLERALRLDPGEPWALATKGMVPNQPRAARRSFVARALRRDTRGGRWWAELFLFKPTELPPEAPPKHVEATHHYLRARAALMLQKASKLRDQAEREAAAAQALSLVERALVRDVEDPSAHVTRTECFALAQDARRMQTAAAEVLDLGRYRYLFPRIREQVLAYRIEDSGPAPAMQAELEAIAQDLAKNEQPGPLIERCQEVLDALGLPHRPATDRLYAYALALQSSAYAQADFSLTATAQARLVEALGLGRLLPLGTRETIRLLAQERTTPEVDPRTCSRQDYLKAAAHARHEAPKEALELAKAGFERWPRDPTVRTAIARTLCAATVSVMTHQKLEELTQLAAKLEEGANPATREALNLLRLSVRGGKPLDEQELARLRRSPDPYAQAVLGRHHSLSFAQARDKGDRTKWEEHFRAAFVAYSKAISEDPMLGFRRSLVVLVAKWAYQQRRPKYQVERALLLAQREALTLIATPMRAVGWECLGYLSAHRARLAQTERESVVRSRRVADLWRLILEPRNKLQDRNTCRFHRMEALYAGYQTGDHLDELELLEGQPSERTRERELRALVLFEHPHLSASALEQIKSLEQGRFWLFRQAAIHARPGPLHDPQRALALTEQAQGMEATSLQLDPVSPVSPVKVRLRALIALSRLDEAEALATRTAEQLRAKRDIPFAELFELRAKNIRYLRERRRE